MARGFSSKDARLIIDDHSSLMARLVSVRDSERKYKNNIKDASDKIVANAVMEVLRGIPVEELNREKRGIKVKLLRDNRYCSMADLYIATVYQIATIKGISEDSAYTIKGIVKSFADQARKGVKIRLSADDRNQFATELVRSISMYRGSLKIIETCNDILFYNKQNTDELIDALKSATNDLKWFFSSKATKNKAIDAYEKLKAKRAEAYYFQAEYELQLLDKNEHIDNFAAWEDFQKNSVSFFTVLEQINPGILGNDDDVYGLPGYLAREIQEESIFTDGLKCSLRRYQKWGVKYILHQKKVLLGDEMGLGKTIQAIATMVSLKNTGQTHFVVVCPASVLSNWCREIEKHSTLRVTKIHGADRSVKLKLWVKNGGVAVTTYETTQYFSLENDFKFSLLVVDEAHYIKNNYAKRTINTVMLSKHAHRLLFMTGTALENKVDEMIALIDIIQPKIASQIRNIAFMSSAPQFREKIAPVYYRRKREDVLSELPKLIENREWCSMLKEEEELYERAVLEKQYVEARRVSWNVENLKNSSKAKRLLEIVEQAQAEERKIIVFSFFLETIHKIGLLLGNRCLNSINGSVSPQRRQEIIDEFDKSPAGSVLLAQIQSGGTGLNIQSASVVVICEPQFKPSIENQAIARAYRMGQARNVLVYRLLCENTVDEKIIAMLEDKQAIFDAFADKSVAAGETLELDEKTLGNIFDEELERIKAKRNKVAAKIDIQNPDIVAPIVEIDSVELDAIKEKASEEYRKQMKLSYKDLVLYLLQKYGPAKVDYFVNSSCRSKNPKISRTSEGLYCHHIDEDKAIQLAKTFYALRNPFDYQKADRLVYCNALEHLLLHIKISEEPRNPNANKMDYIGVGGANNIICEINDLYNSKVFSQKWRENIFRAIENSFDDYIVLLKYFWWVLQHDSRYLIARKEELVVGWDGNVVPRVYNELFDK